MEEGREERRESEILNQLRKHKHVWNALPFILACTHIPAEFMYMCNVGVQEFTAVWSHIRTYYITSSCTHAVIINTKLECMPLCHI